MIQLTLRDENKNLRRTLHKMYPEGAKARRNAVRMCRGGAENLMLSHESTLLWALAKQYNYDGAHFLEIGTYKGCSCSVMAQAAPLAQIQTLEVDAQAARDARDVLSVFPNVLVKTEDSSIYLRTYNGPMFNLILIDGDHRRIAQDIPWWSWLIGGGLILFHDYWPGQFDEIVKAVDGLAMMVCRKFSISTFATDTSRGFVGIYK